MTPTHHTTTVQQGLREVRDAQPADRATDAGTHRRFTLERAEDVTGVSGTGTVAEGVQFSDGKAVVRWIVGDDKSTVHWDNVDSVLAVHGHDGRTTINWIDQ